MFHRRIVAPKDRDSVETVTPTIEALLRRANYSVSRAGREAHLPSLIKVGPTTYMPDFLAWREEPISRPGGGIQLFDIVAIEVKYRRQPERFLTDEAPKVFDEAGDRWPNFCLVLVTDNPAADRSCFQVLRRDQARRAECTDIANAGFGVYSTTAWMFSLLLKQVFHSLNEEVTGDGVGSQTGA
jgi:hypothetical protein